MARSTTTATICAALLMLAPVGSGIADPNPQRARQQAAPPTDSVAALRAEGPAALDALFAKRDALTVKIESAGDSERAQSLRRRLEQLDATIDRVGGQRYCSRSRLFWYTDFQTAQNAARQSGKPILSLHMLGKLTDEYSCANSRFFRTALYANADISKYLREHFVLHWKSVRPVPVITVDFGDGRKMVRTITGNSAHHVLASDGRPVDVIPGLYGPKAFLKSLARAEEMVTAYESARDDNARLAVLRRLHTSAHAQLAAAWEKDLRAAGVKFPASPAHQPAAPDAKNAAPPAGAAAAVAFGKSLVERPILNLVMADTSGLEQATTRDAWEKIAALHADDVKLDNSSRALVREHHGAAELAAKLARSKTAVEDPLLRVVRQFEASMAVDTVRNEYELHRKIHQWFAQSDTLPELSTLNERVYAELFLTPSSDPWLGLNPPDTYTALPGEGLLDNRR